MKFLQTVQKNFVSMGFAPNQQQNKHWQASSGQIIDISFCTVDAILVALYIFYDANDIEQYMESIFSLIVVVAITIAYSSIIFENDKVFSTIKLCEDEMVDSMDHKFCIIRILHSSHL